MRTGFRYEAARAAALVSLSWLSWPGMLPAGRAASAPGAPGGSGGSGGSGSSIEGILDEIWGLAWGLDFTLNESGMSLEPTGVEGVWNVTVFEQLDPVATGLYLELHRLPLPALSESMPDDAVSLEHAATVGVLIGSTSFAAPIWGLAQHVGIDGDQPMVVEGFTPLGVATDLNGALDEALQIVAMVEAAQPAAAEPPYTPGDDPCYCDEIYDTDVNACRFAALACEGACTAVALGGLIACMFTGPLVPACIAVVIAAEAVCIAACLAQQRSCNLQAYSAWLVCEYACAPSPGQPGQDPAP